ncbi:CDP-glucose 4,6-dehydratase [Pseudobacteriovorax antillogorgiicola]|uniref:CDP-glucose 4,6-dehydratase n=1 Tax=Pseudobacteriovorax antillogorgiicola TaxID=1513793 RepID=A0A1Y6CLD3_9BACT|nr:CDP-glucose 4,6-dehydratase [Pseudobacteriovorax antillogorgiicola]TCS45218.1 CDP-glucose 4,6-dehydratase [Pseudobacteriovorax antillogorgiicola]SMF75438.1 CDP-glucose 4,6-dehydratase [Pseudobacteriovorax antillogorgiicola]
MFDHRYRGTSVLVTGHTGFKGSWLSQWLLDLSARVTGFSLYIPSQPSNYEVLNLQNRMESVEGDIRNYRDLLQVVENTKPDIIFHLAAQPIVSASISEPLSTFETNIVGSANVLQVARMSDSVKAVVMVTSDKCYDNVEWEFGYRETDRLGGKDPYSASKGAAELVIHSMIKTYFRGESATRIATGRAGNVIGGGDWALDRIVPDSIRAWSQGLEPTIRSPNATRPWQHVLEPLSGYLWLGAQLLSQECRVHGESFNFGPNAKTIQSVKDLIKEMTRHWEGKSWKVKRSEGLTGKEAGLLKLCCDKALARLDWAPVLSFGQTVEYTSRWYKNFYDANFCMAEVTESQIHGYCDLAKEQKLRWAL